MSKINIYDPHLEKDGKKIKKVYITCVDHPDEPLLCDCCDEKKPLAHIHTI